MDKKPPKDLRIPIMMTTAEVEAIDNWRFANRIATRAEAVRRLCQTGLGFDARGEEVYKSAEQALETVAELVAVIMQGAGAACDDQRKLIGVAVKALAASKSHLELAFDFLVTAASMNVDTPDEIILRFTDVFDAVRAYRKSAGQ